MSSIYLDKADGQRQKPGRFLDIVRRWFDTSHPVRNEGSRGRIDPLRILPFALMHLMVLGVFVVGWSPVALWVALGLYLFRMFAITAFLHRYFSHRSFRTSRAFQFLMGVAGCLAIQRGPLWWAGHHRLHHRHSDAEGDPHSPRRSGFWWSHMGWFLSDENFATPEREVRDLARFPELRWLDRFWIVPGLLLAVGLYVAGSFIEQTSGAQLLIWGFFVSTVVLYHATYTINSLAHCFGRRRFPTRDDSRNNAWLALITLGEGWHNNHHHYPGSTRQGFRWWEFDPSWYLLELLSCFGLVWGFHPVPVAHRQSRKELS